MKSTSFVLSALMASVAIAQPHRQHMAKHHKRDANNEVVWVTDWVYATETVGVTTTIWVSEGYVEPTTAPTTTTSASSSSSAAPKPAQAAQAAGFFENANKPKPSTTSISSVYVAPTPAYVAPVAASPPYVAPAPVPTTSTQAPPPYVAPVVQSAAPVVEAPQPAPVPETTTSAAPVAAPAPVYSAPSSSSPSTGGACSSGSTCSGDITYYEAGLGACGIVNDGNVEKVIALPHGLMGTQSNGNPYCGKTVTIKHKGKTTTATVVDKCMGCVGNSIDLSNAAFLELDSLDVGRTTAEWWFN